MKNEEEQLFLSKISSCYFFYDKRLKYINKIGGMTNVNYLCEVNDEKVVVRIPGANTEYLINRTNEKINCEQATVINLNPKLFFYDVHSGIKITKYVNDSYTLTKSDLLKKDILCEVVKAVKKLHNSKIKFNNFFTPFLEYERYKSSGELVFSSYDGFFDVEKKFIKIESILNNIGPDISPCHNDLVPENILFDSDDKCHIIDWEYSGYNDRFWDIAALIEESNLPRDLENILIQDYCDKSFDLIIRAKEKILLHKICQNFLWAVWTVIKEKDGNLFDGYGLKRFNRCKDLIKSYESHYRTL